MTEDALRQMFLHLNNVPYRDFPFQIAVGGKLLGIAGPAFLLAPVALLSLRFPAGRLCLLSFLVFLPPFFASTDVRFLLPSLTFLAFAIGMGLTSIPRVGTAVAVIAFHAYRVAGRGAEIRSGISSGVSIWWISGCLCGSYPRRNGSPGTGRITRPG